MAAAAPAIQSALEDREGLGESEKLLNRNQVLLVPVVNQEDGGLLSNKSSKKVKLPEDGSPSVGKGQFTIGPAEAPPERVPPDGNWGWFVLVGATVVNILIPGTIKSFGVLLLEFNDVFQASASASSGIVALCYFLYSSLGPLSSILSVRWSYRTVTLIGGSFAAFGMILSSWAQSISYLYFSFGAMVGAGAGLAFPPTVYIVTSYFVRLRGLANGICMSGSAFGSIILPPVLRYLLETYGYQGTVLVLGGIMLNVWAAALLFQPAENHYVIKPRPPDDDDDDQPQDQRDVLLEEDETELNSMEMSNVAGNQAGERPAQPLQPALPSAPSQIHMRAPRRKLSHPRSVIRTEYSSASITMEEVKRGQDGRKLSNAGPRRNFSTSSFAHVATPFHGSTLSAFERPNEFASQFSIKSIAESVTEVVVCCFCFKRKKKDQIERDRSKKFLDLDLLKDPTYLVILVSSSTVAISCTNFIILLPSHAANIGFDKAKGALLLSTVSALDLVGRIGGSTLCDLNIIPKSFYFVGGLFFSGIFLATIPFLRSYVALSVFCALFGLASGVNNSVTTLVMAEVLGVERLSSTYGISLFVNGILQLIGPPICGLWFEYDQNYTLMFLTFGMIFIAGASLWLLMPLIERRKRRKLEAGGRLNGLEPFAEEDDEMELPDDHSKMLYSEDTVSELKHPNGSPPGRPRTATASLDDPKMSPKDFARSASAALVAVDRTRKSTPVSSRHGLHNISSRASNHLPSNPSLLESVPEGRTGVSQDMFGRKLGVPKTPKRSVSTSSFQYMSTPFHGSTLSAFEKPSEFASQFSLKSVTDSLAPIAYCCGCRKKKPKEDTGKKERSKYFDIQLLKDPIYLVILISNCTCAISYTNFIILVPSYAVECGFDKSRGAYLLSMISALDLVGRIGGSALSDVVVTPKRYFFITGLLLSGVSLAAIPLVSSYAAISAFCSIFGIASGINVGVTALVMTEMLGTERLMSSYGISLFMNGILQLIGPPICGFWFEYSKSYKSLFITLGFILVGGACLWGFVPLINGRRKRALIQKDTIGDQA